MKLYLSQLLPVLLFCFFSCEKDVLLMPSHEPKLAISGYLYPDSCTVIISVSKNTFPKSFGKIPLITGEQVAVVLYENGVFFDSLRPYSKRVIGSNPIDSIQNGYVSLKKATPGASYRLNVSCPGYPSVSAQTTLPVAVPILSADTLHIPQVNTPFQYSEVVIYSIRRVLDFTFSDPTGQNNYYVLNVSSKVNSAPADSNYSMNLEDNLLFEHQESGDVYADYYGDLSYRFFSDKYLRGTKGSFKYFYGSMDDPNNETIIPDYVIDEMNVNRDSSDFIPYHQAYTWVSYVPDNVTVRLYSISEDYYKYNLSKLKYREAERDPNSEPVIVYSNVTGGYGIFAGISYSDYTYRFAKE